MTAPEVELRAAWHHLAGGQHLELLESLLLRLREPHRRYHTATHVMWVLRRLPTEHPNADLAALRLAALYHDAVYDPRAISPANEVASAELAADAARQLRFDEHRVALVRRLILATAHTGTHIDAPVEEQLLVAADLAILAAEPAEYSAYVRGVRAEYSHVSDADWQRGRSAVLEHFLADTTLPARARANLSAELAGYR